MGRITGSTKEIIRNYYKNKISILKEERNKEEEKYKEEFLNNFNNDKEVREINEKIEKLNLRFGFEFQKIYFPKWRIKTENCSEVYNINKEILSLENERDKIIMILECYPKQSEEYKKVLEIVGNMFKGE